MKSFIDGFDSVDNASSTYSDGSSYHTSDDSSETASSDDAKCSRKRPKFNNSSEQFKRDEHFETDNSSSDCVIRGKAYYSARPCHKRLNSYSYNKINKKKFGVKGYSRKSKRSDDDFIDDKTSESSENTSIDDSFAADFPLTLPFRRKKTVPYELNEDFEVEEYNRQSQQSKYPTKKISSSVNHLNNESESLDDDSIDNDIKINSATNRSTDGSFGFTLPRRKLPRRRKKPVFIKDPFDSDSDDFTQTINVKRKANISSSSDEEVIIKKNVNGDDRMLSIANGTSEIGCYPITKRIPLQKTNFLELSQGQDIKSTFADDKIMRKESDPSTIIENQKKKVTKQLSLKSRLMKNKCGAYRCIKCKHVSKCKVGYETHLLTHLLIKPYACLFCNYETSCIDHFQMHKGSHEEYKIPLKKFDYCLKMHNDVIPEFNSSNIVNNQTLCDFSTLDSQDKVNSRTFNSTENLLINVSSFQGSTCNFETDKSGNLPIYGKFLNLVSKPESFICCQCSFSTSTNFALNMHCKKIHRIMK